MRPIARPFAALAILSAALAGPTPSLAAPGAVDAAGAAALEALLEERLGRLARAKDGVRLDRAPDATVTPRGDAYAIRLPEVRVVTPSGALVEAAEIGGTAVPVDGGGWEIKATIPAPLAVFGPEGFRLGEVTIGRQAFTGRWADDLRTLVGLDTSYRDVLFTPREGKGTVRLGTLAATMKPDSYAGGRWTGPATLTVADLLARDADGTERLALGRLSAKVRIEGLDVARYAAWNAAAAVRAAVDDGRDGLNEAERTATLAALPHLDRMLSAWTGTLDVKELRRVRPDGTKEALPSLTATLDATGLDTDRARLNLDYAHKGLTAAGPSVKREVVPADGGLTLSGTALPLSTLRDAHARRLKEQPAIGDKAASQKLNERVTRAMAEAGAELRLDRLDFQAPEAGAVGNGQFTFDDATARGLMGGLTLTLRGFEALVAQAGGGGRNPGPALALYALQGLGAADTDRQGRPVRTYRIEVAADGRVLLNGTDVSGLLDGLLSFR